LGGNIDPRQMEELPVLGRNWMNLVTLAPGARTTANSNTPHSVGLDDTIRLDFQINLDGQQITYQGSRVATKGQPSFSRDAIAEFEFLSSRFDATQSRSSGVQVNAVTKSGTNTPSGSFAGYFRHDRFNAADHVAKRVLPYQNQQLSTTFGGPIRKDRVHIFAHYEYERFPQTLFYVTPFAHFNRELSTNNREKKGGARLDAQFSPRTRLAVRGNMFRYLYPINVSEDGGGSVFTPGALRSFERDSSQYLATLTQVLSNRAVNEVKVGYTYYASATRPIVKNVEARFFGVGGPQVQLQGVTVGTTRFTPDNQSQAVYSVRDDFTYSFSKSGRHTMKLGAEYLRTKFADFRCFPCDGRYDAPGGPMPVPVETLFPDILDSTTWNLAPLSPIMVSVSGIVGKFDQAFSQGTFGVWVQDDWTLSPRLTLNLGLRYDVEFNAFANKLVALPFMPPGSRPNDTNNVSPRLGFSASLTDRTVVRGGFGVYFGTIYTSTQLRYPYQNVNFTVFNDLRPDFAANPFNGPLPSYETLQATLCTPALEPGCVRKDVLAWEANLQMPFSYQSSLGLQRQLGATMAFEADYVYVGPRQIPRSVGNVNLTYDPVTGANRPFRTISTRSFPEWGSVDLTRSADMYNSHALQTAFTKRMSNGWQASGTYTLSGLWDEKPRPVQWTGSGFEEVPFATAPDLGGEYSLAGGDQRHRAVVNGIWQLRYGLQLSGLYFFGSGERQPTTWGVNLRGPGANSGERRLKPDGSYVARNSFVAKPIHRVDLRAQRRFALGGRAGIDGILEVFNLFNHANYGSYITEEVSAAFGQPIQNPDLAYAPRMLQLGFRFAF
jgi:hypothetical protein